MKTEEIDGTCSSEDDIKDHEVESEIERKRRDMEIVHCFPKKRRNSWSLFGNGY